MKKTWIITKRELASFFDSLTAYVMVVLFLGLSGIFTWLVGSNIFVNNQANMGVFFWYRFLVTFFLHPCIDHENGCGGK
jgi:ABC-2 type transport system permease protein